MSEDNSTRQEDEIQALGAIYEESWTTLDEATRTYNVCISVANVENTVNFQVTLPPEYPTGMPPYYQLSAPWLRGSARLEISSALDDIYWNNVGESILYLWIERVREFLQDTFEEGDGEPLDRLTKVDSEDLTESDELFHGDALASFSVSDTSSVDRLPEVISGSAVTVKRSTFQAHVAAVVSPEQVNLVLTKLKEDKKIAHATHNISAYRIYNEKTKAFIQDNDDDGETHAGARVLHLLQILDVKNVLVVVSRWYGGVKLGPDRFRHINNCARSILVQTGFVQCGSPVTVASSAKLISKKKI